MSFLETPVLTVNANTIHGIDTENVKDLFGLWTLFSRCSDSIKEGRRLENLSWRLWNRETFCCAPGEANATTPAISIPSSSEGSNIADIPGLSCSIDSIDEEDIEPDYESASISPPLTITKPRVRWQDSGCNRNRGKERHITPDDLEKMVITIQEKKDLEPLTVKITPLQLSNTATPIIPQKSPPSTTTTDETSTSVVRGFFPFQISPSYQSIRLISTLASGPKSALASNTRLAAPTNYALFALAGSSQSDNDSFQQLGGSSAEDENSLRNSMQKSSHRSSLSDALRRPEQKKQTSFKEEVATRTIEEMSDDVFETDDDIDESAIDDDKSSDWEDSMEDSGKSSVDDKLCFPRVESRRDLTSRRSLITTMLHQNDRAAAIQGAASTSTSALQRSRTSTPKGPSDAPSPESDDSAPLTMKIRMRPGQKVPRTGAQPINMTTTNATPHQAALSPKTTRRQMLATELTASLRRHLLWERKQKNQTASAVLKRRHSAHYVAKLKQYPDKVHLGTEDKGNYGSWNQYFSQCVGEYHSKGW
ncbi:hypothetical protein V496_07247 [Pseudogymnoascus sp. VKM F-4515 (FW-2607)]|nr:hypothetical protein V496_07247 [Pseudogymnoascus sp. VKM F-4515 (FW-2607)]